MTVPLYFTMTAGLVSAVIVILAITLRKRYELALLPSTVIHELMHIAAGRLFKGRNASFTINLDASAVTTQVMRQPTGPITWFGIWFSTFAGYFAPPIAAVGVAVGVEKNWPVVTAIALAVVFVCAPLLCTDMRSFAITLLPSLLVVGALILFKHSPHDLTLVLAVFAIHISFSGVGQALNQIRAVVLGSPGVVDARILSGMSFIPAIVYAIVHLLASLAGAVAVIVLLV